MLERGAIELAPLAYMRGRTLNHSFIILDEAQNTTPEQMKMFLTRIGFGSKAVVTGDVTQVDLPRGAKSGLVEARRILAEVRGVAFSIFQTEDVVRHPLVQRIVDAYERHRDERERRAMTRAGIEGPGPNASHSTRRAALALTLQIATRSRRLPAPARLRRWARAALAQPARVTLRIVGEREGESLNREFRRKPHATNVLTFCYAR